MLFQVPDSKIVRAATYREAGEARYREAEFLVDRFPSAAVYLAGYVVECHLKWAICEREGVSYLHDLPNRRIVDELTSGKGHDLEFLVAVARYDLRIRRTASLRDAFFLVADWSPYLRYNPRFVNRANARRFLLAIRVLRDDIRSWAH